MCGWGGGFMLWGLPWGSQARTRLGWHEAECVSLCVRGGIGYMRPELMRGCQWRT